MKQIKVISVVGARPQIIKAAALYRTMKNHDDIQQVLVHSGQHYDESLSYNFFKELDLPSPEYNLNIGSREHNIFIGQFLEKFDKILTEERPHMVLVYGDTNTTAAAAIATAKRHIPLAHVEAGLREWDKSIPEEVNKLITDAVTDLYFTPTQTGKHNLKQQGITKNVFLTGDIHYDLLKDDGHYTPRTDLEQRFGLTGDYVFMTCHREANTTKNNLTAIIDAASKVALPVIWPVHPRTMGNIRSYKLEQKLLDNIITIEPIGFWDTQSLIKNASYVITDSGGVIKEAYYHKTPSIIIDNQTEWVEIVKEGWATVTGPDKNKILNTALSIKTPENHHLSLLQDDCGKIIITEIKKFLYAKE